VHRCIAIKIAAVAVQRVVHHDEPDLVSRSPRMLNQRGERRL